MVGKKHLDHVMLDFFTEYNGITLVAIHEILIDCNQFAITVIPIVELYNHHFVIYDAS